MSAGRLAVWFLRHPMAGACAMLVVLALVTASVAVLLRSPAPEPPSPAMDARVAPATLPTPTQSPPRRRVAAAHRALHALGRACETPMARRERGAVRRPVAAIGAFARDYPSAGFDVDDESGTTLTLLIVVRAQLEACEPALVGEVEALIPRQYRGD